MRFNSNPAHRNHQLKQSAIREEMAEQSSCDEHQDEQHQFMIEQSTQSRNDDDGQSSFSLGIRRRHSLIKQMQESSRKTPLRESYNPARVSGKPKTLT